MLSLASLCSAVFLDSTRPQKKFSSVFQANLDLSLNTKSVHNHVIKLL
jgi:hypothetical protein